MDKKGTDKQYVADSLIQSTICNTWCLYQISKPKSSSSLEILDGKKFTHRQSNILTEIPPLYHPYQL